MITIVEHSSELLTISQWLKQLNVAFYQCDSCTALHLSYLQNLDGVADAKIELIDNIIVISVIAEIKQSSIIALLAEISQINQSTFFSKAYLDINDNSNAKIIFAYSLHVTEGLTFNQFSMSLASLEEEALQIIGELYSCELLSNSHSVNGDLEQVISHTVH